MVFCDDVALVARTDNMTKERWLEIRRSGIGGSDAGAVCGFNRYKNAIDVWFDKTKKINDKKDNEAMRQGRDLEGYVAERFCEATGKKVYELPVMLGNVNYPYALADVDRLVDGEQAGLECKTANLYSEKRWAGGSIPPEYELQCHHYMMVTGAECWYIACLIYGRDFIWHKIERDEELIKGLATIEKRYWENYVLTGNMPPAEKGSNGVWQKSEEYKKADDERVIDVQKYSDALDRREEITQLIKRLEDEKKGIEQDIKAYMGDAAMATSQRYRVDWKNVNSSKIDTDLLKKEYREVYDKCLKKTTTRRFSIKRISE